MAELIHDDGQVQLYRGRSPDDFDAVGDFDLVVTSPPYNLGRSTGGGFNASSPTDFADYDEHDDALPWDEYVDWQNAVLAGLWDRLPDHGAIYYNVKARVQGGELVHPLRWIDPRFTVRQVIIWNRSIGVNFSPTFFTPTHELVILIARPGYRLASRSEGFDVWNISPCRPHTKDHPCPFPVELPARAIRASERVTRVFDPFVGSGTTCMAAKAAGIPSVGLDLSAAYLTAATDLLSATYVTPALF